MVIRKNLNFPLCKSSSSLLARADRDEMRLLLLLQVVFFGHPRGSLSFVLKASFPTPLEGHHV